MPYWLFKLNNKKENIMKNVIKIIVISLVILFSGKSFSQEKSNITTVEIEVKGVCGMCKERIENAAYIKGVKKVEWNKETQKLTVTYRNDKVTEDAIHQSVAKAGHETNKVKADPEAYKKLPACCSYNDGVESH